MKIIYKLLLSGLLAISLSACGERGIHLEAVQEQYLHFKEVERKTNAIINTECFRNGMLAAQYDYDQDEGSRHEDSPNDVVDRYREASIDVPVEIVADNPDFLARTNGDWIQYTWGVVNYNDDMKWIVAITVHEMAHILGYGHVKSNLDPKYSHSVPDIGYHVALNCMRAGY